MITIFANNADAYVSQYETLTSGRNGMTALFLLQKEHWEDLNVLINFMTSDGVIRSAIFEPLVDFEHTQCDLSGYIPGVAVIPAAVMETAGIRLLAGVKGASQDGTVVIPTIYCDLGEVQQGASVDGEIDQVEDGREIIEAAYEIAVDAQAKAEEALDEIAHGGGGSAVSPTVEITEIPGGHHIKITDKDGDHECDIMDGVSSQIQITPITNGYRLTISDATGTHSVDIYNGQHGFSPQVDITQITNGYRISITDSTGTSTAEIYNGNPGADGSSVTCATQSVSGGTQVTLTDKNGDHSFIVYDGQDGVSPQISASAITGGTRLTIVDASGTTTVDILDGKDGSSVTCATQSVSGGTQVTLTDKNGDHTFTISDGVSPQISSSAITGGTRLTIVDASGTTTVDILNGVDGVSPTITVNAVTGGHEVVVQDKNGTQRFTVLDGIDGSSVTYSTQAITGGTRVTLTDKNGSTSFDVMDGFSPSASVSKSGNTTTIQITDKNGTTTAQVTDGDSGATFTPSVDASGNVSWTNDKSLPNPQTQNIKGPAGPGVPSGGTQGQILVKQSSTDYDAAWVTLATWQGGSY